MARARPYNKNQIADTLPNVRSGAPQIEIKKRRKAQGKGVCDTAVYTAGKAGPKLCKSPELVEHFALVKLGWNRRVRITRPTALTDSFSVNGCQQKVCFFA
jgi:hypothetical protein